MKKITNLTKRDWEREFVNPEGEEEFLRIQWVKRDMQGYVHQTKGGEELNIKRLASKNFIGMGKPGSIFCVLPQKEFLDENPRLIMVSEKTESGEIFTRMAIPMEALLSYKFLT